MNEAAPLRLGFSPCPNDCFIFDALVHQRTPFHGVLDTHLDDVEALNQAALAGTLDVAKVSYHAFGLLAQEWWMLRSGGALGRGVGPLIVRRRAAPPPSPAEWLRGRRVAVPGGTTTARLLLRLFGGSDFEEVHVRYDRIMPMVASGEVDAGLIIHESRFTYAEHGLDALVDLGAWWEERTGLLLPLGGIAVRRALGAKRAREIDAAVRASVAAAFADPSASSEFVAAHAQELAPAVRQSHIDLYVNRYSLDVSSEGEAAVRALLAEGAAIAWLPPPPEDLFVPTD